MEGKTLRRWQLQDLLHHEGEAGITQSDYGDPNGGVLQARNDPIHQSLEVLQGRSTTTTDRDYQRHWESRL